MDHDEPTFNNNEQMGIEQLMYQFGEFIDQNLIIDIYLSCDRNFTNTEEFLTEMANQTIKEKEQTNKRKLEVQTNNQASNNNQSQRNNYDVQVAEFYDQHNNLVSRNVQLWKNPTNEMQMRDQANDDFRNLDKSKQKKPKMNKNNLQEEVRNYETRFQDKRQGNIQGINMDFGLSNNNKMNDRWNGFEMDDSDQEKIRNAVKVKNSKKNNIWGNSDDDNLKQNHTNYHWNTNTENQNLIQANKKPKIRDGWEGFGSDDSFDNTKTHSKKHQKSNFDANEFDELEIDAITTEATQRQVENQAQEVFIDKFRDDYIDDEFFENVENQEDFFKLIFNEIGITEDAINELCSKNTEQNYGKYEDNRKKRRNRKNKQNFEADKYAFSNSAKMGNDARKANVFMNDFRTPKNGFDFPQTSHAKDYYQNSKNTSDLNTALFQNQRIHNRKNQFSKNDNRNNSNSNNEQFQNQNNPYYQNPNSSSNDEQLDSSFERLNTEKQTKSNLNRINSRSFKTRN